MTDTDELKTLIEEAAALWPGLMRSRGGGACARYEGWHTYDECQDHIEARVRDWCDERRYDVETRVVNEWYLCIIRGESIPLCCGRSKTFRVIATLRAFIAAFKAVKAEPKPIEAGNVYGFCPKCGAKGYVRERRLNGNDRCENGHEYPSKDAKPAPKPVREILRCATCQRGIDPYGACSFSCKPLPTETQRLEMIGRSFNAAPQPEADSVGKIADEMDRWYYGPTPDVHKGFIARLRKLADAKPTMPKSVEELLRNVTFIMRALKANGDHPLLRHDLESDVAAVRADFATKGVTP